MGGMNITPFGQEKKENAAASGSIPSASTYSFMPPGQVTCPVGCKKVESFLG